MLTQRDLHADAPKSTQVLPKRPSGVPGRPLASGRSVHRTQGEPAGLGLECLSASSRWRSSMPRQQPLHSLAPGHAHMHLGCRPLSAMWQSPLNFTAPSLEAVLTCSLCADRCQHCGRRPSGRSFLHAPRGPQHLPARLPNQPAGRAGLRSPGTAACTRSAPPEGCRAADSPGGGRHGVSGG